MRQACNRVQWRLQPYVIEPATRPETDMREGFVRQASLQPCVVKAATVGQRGCNRM